MQRVNSSSVESVGYNRETGELTICYLKRGTFVYFGVPEEIYDNLINSSSVGNFVNQMIKNQYSYSKR